MMKNGRRRVRSGWCHGHDENEAVLPKPRAGHVKWRDHLIHQTKGYSSFFDLQLSQVESPLVDWTKGENIGLDRLWYSNADYDEERQTAKSDFFRLLGAREENRDDLISSWNRLTAYVPLGRCGHYVATGSPASSPPTSPESSIHVQGDESPPTTTMAHLTRRGSPVGLSNFEIHGLIGAGSFGRVMRVTKLDTGTEYAMKVVCKDTLLAKGQGVVRQAITEKQVLQQMATRPHPYVVSLRYAFQTDDRLYLVMVCERAGRTGQRSR